MEIYKDAESQARGARSTQESKFKSSINGGSQERITRGGGQHEPVGERTHRATRSGRNTYAAINGKIIQALKTTYEEKRSEAIECLDWYQREIEKCDRHIEELESLERLAEESCND